MEFKPTPMYGNTGSSVSKVLPSWISSKYNRVNKEIFQLAFSCNFDFAEFPFDTQECPLEYGDGKFTQFAMRFNRTGAVFGNQTTGSGDDPIILNNLPFPFEFQLVSLPTFEFMDRNMIPYSYTGIVLKTRRKSPGQLLIGYFYPTAAFALLSMISFLIKPDVVSSLCQKCGL